MRRVLGSGSPIFVLERVEKLEWAGPNYLFTTYVRTLHSAYDLRTGERIA